MKYKIQLTQKAKEDFLLLDNKTQKRIASKMRFYIIQNNPLQFAKKLTNFQLGGYRFRIGDYRVIFDLDKNGQIIILLILRVKHRREAYL